jgi:hypothetical protein
MISIKNLVYSAFLIFICTASRGQLIMKRENITDSTIFEGVVSSFCRPIKVINENNCSVTEFGDYINKNERVFIYGVYKCVRPGTFKTVLYYKVCYGSELYLIEEDDVVSQYPNDIEIIKELSNIDAEKLMSRSQIYAQNIQTREIERKQKLDDSIATKAEAILKSFSNKPIAICSYGIEDESEYTDGTKFEISVYNPTKKTIKYLWVTFIGINAVGDKVSDNLTGKTNITLKGVGPMESGQNSRLQLNYAWHTDLVDDVKIVSVKVQYMDNTIKIITNPKSIEMPNFVVQHYEW